MANQRNIQISQRIMWVGISSAIIQLQICKSKREIKTKKNEDKTVQRIVSDVNWIKARASIENYVCRAWLSESSVWVWETEYREIHEESF